MSRPSPECKGLDVTVVHRCSAPNRQPCLPAGHSLSQARLRYLRASDWVVVSDEAVPLALAAYKRVDSEVRVVHELLLDRTLGDPDAARVTEVLLAALEMVAYDEGVSCLTFLLRGSVVMGPFEQRGYMSLVLDSAGMWWLQRKLGWLGWSEIRSGRPN